jgi:hypothetical protein
MSAGDWNGNGYYGQGSCNIHNCPSCGRCRTCGQSSALYPQYQYLNTFYDSAGKPVEVKAFDTPGWFWDDETKRWGHPLP